MWNTSVKIEYIAGLIVDALENYSVNRENAQFRLVIEELRNHFTNCSEQEITDIISLCMKMYSSKKIEHAELCSYCTRFIPCENIKNQRYNA